MPVLSVRAEALSHDILTQHPTHCAWHPVFSALLEERTWGGRDGRTVGAERLDPSLGICGKLAIAQLAEHLTAKLRRNHMVPGSIPGGQSFSPALLWRRAVTRHLSSSAKTVR